MKSEILVESKLYFVSPDYFVSPTSKGSMCILIQKATCYSSTASMVARVVKKTQNDVLPITIIKRRHRIMHLKNLTPG